MSEEDIVERVLKALSNEKHFDNHFEIEPDVEFEPGYSEPYEHFGNKGFQPYGACVHADTAVTVKLDSMDMGGMTLRELVDDWDIMESVRDYVLGPVEESVQAETPGIMGRPDKMEFSAPVIDEEAKELYFRVGFSAGVERDPYAGCD